MLLMPWPLMVNPIMKHLYLMIPLTCHIMKYLLLMIMASPNPPPMSLTDKTYM